MHSPITFIQATGKKPRNYYELLQSIGIVGIITNYKHVSLTYNSVLFRIIL